MKSPNRASLETKPPPIIERSLFLIDQQIYNEKGIMGYLTIHFLWLWCMGYWVSDCRREAVSKTPKCKVLVLEKEDGDQWFNKCLQLWPRTPRSSLLNWSRTGQAGLELAWGWLGSGSVAKALQVENLHHYHSCGWFEALVPGFLSELPCLLSQNLPEQRQHHTASVRPRAGSARSVGLSSTQSPQSPSKHWSSYKGFSS